MCKERMERSQLSLSACYHVPGMVHASICFISLIFFTITYELDIFSVESDKNDLPKLQLYQRQSPD